MEQLSFQISGEYVCDLARAWFWEEGRPYEVCERLLMGCLITDEQTPEERKSIAIGILEGRQKLVGINTFHLEEDGEIIRPLSQKFQQYERKEMIQRIRSDMEARPLAYVDRFAAPRPLEEYEEIRHWQRDEAPDPAALLRPADKVRMYLYAQTNVIGAARLEPGYYEGEQPLDRGLYLLEHPDWVYDFIGDLLSEENEALLYQKLYEFWENRANVSCPPKWTAAIRVRNERYLAFLRTDGAPGAKPARLPVEEKDELLYREEPDDFISDYGVIDRQGKWYSCTFGGHNAKAYTLVSARREQFGFKPKEYIPHRDRALDLLFGAGWVILQNPFISSYPAVEFKAGLRPTKAQVDTVFDYMAHFGRHRLEGLEKIL